MKTKENFYIATKATFDGCRRPSRKPDFVSRCGSEYWYTPNGVIRCSDHWSIYYDARHKCSPIRQRKIASCFWGLRSTKDLIRQCGFAKWSAFSSM